jgi:integrase
VFKAKITNFRWHDLRHTFTSRLRIKSAPLEDVADLQGHRRYARLGPNKLHALVSLLKPSDARQNGVSASVTQVIVK